MSETHAFPESYDESGLYEIRLKGHLHDRWADWFGDVVITLEDNGNTLLLCPVVDQAALHGLLKKVRDLGMPLVSVNQVNHSGYADNGQQTTDHSSRPSSVVHDVSGYVHNLC